MKGSKEGTKGILHEHTPTNTQVPNSSFVTDSSRKPKCPCTMRIQFSSNRFLEVDPHAQLKVSPTPGCSIAHSAGLKVAQPSVNVPEIVNLPQCNIQQFWSFAKPTPDKWISEVTLSVECKTCARTPGCAKCSIPPLLLTTVSMAVLSR